MIFYEPFKGPSQLFCAFVAGGYHQGAKLLCWLFLHDRLSVESDPRWLVAHPQRVSSSKCHFGTLLMQSLVIATEASEQRVVMLFSSSLLHLLGLSPSQEPMECTLVMVKSKVFITCTYTVDHVLNVSNLLFGAARSHLPWLSHLRRLANMQDVWNVIDIVILAFDLTRLGNYSYGTEKNVRMMLSTRAVRIVTLTPEMKSLVISLLRTMPVIASVFGLGEGASLSLSWFNLTNVCFAHDLWAM